MPMDYDDTEFHIHHNAHLAGEGGSTVLGPYDYDDSLQGHLRFDSLVENEVFLGITGQEDNQWIEEYSRGNSPSAAELTRRNNVWSEATSSESFDMLLKSVGQQQEEGVIGETVTEELDASDEPGSLAANMDPNLKQDDGDIHAQEAIVVTNKPQDNFFDSNAIFDCDKSHDTIATQSQKAKVSGGELDLGKKSEEKVNSICDVNQVAKKLAIDSHKHKLQDNNGDMQEECEGTNSTQNFNASNKEDMMISSSSNEAEYSVNNTETSMGMDNPVGGHTALETCTNSDEKPCLVSNVESLNRAPLAFEGDISLNEESTSVIPVGSCDLAMTETCKACESSSVDGSKRAVTAPMCFEVQELNDHMHHKDSLAMPPVAVAAEDNNTKSQILVASLESKVSDDVQSQFVDETENTNAHQATPSAFEDSDPSDICGEGSSINDVGYSLTAKACSSPALVAGHLLNTDLVSNNTPKANSDDLIDKDQSPAAKLSSSEQVNDDIRSSGIFMNQDVTFNEGGNGLPMDPSNDTDVEVVAALDTQNNVESASSAEGCKFHVSEADVTIPDEPVAAVKSAMVLSPDTSVRVNLHSGCVASDDQKKKEAGDGTCENGSPKVAVSMVDCASEGSLLVVEEGGALSPDHAGKVLHGVSSHCAASPVENMTANVIEQAQEANFDDGMMNSEPCNASVKVGDNVEEAGGVQEAKESMSGCQIEAPLSLAVFNMSNEQQASTDVLPPPPLECDDTHMKHGEDSCISMDKLQSVSSLNINSTELSQCVKATTREMAEEGGVIYKNLLFPKVTEDVEGKAQSVSSNNDTRNDESLTFEVSATVGPGQTDKGPQSFPAIQSCNVQTKNTEGPSNNSSSSCILDAPRKPSEGSPFITQIPGDATTPGTGVVGAKGNSERKTQRKSVRKESVKKVKELTPRLSGRVEKSSALLSPPAATTAGHVIQAEELKLKDKVECSATKPSGILPIPTTNLPDLNSATCIFQQPFTDNQQIQLRAQILVYGSLISGTGPEEPHMTAAFGQSDGGRKTWEAAWHACLERVHAQKSQVNTPMQPPRSDLNEDVVIGHGNRATSLSKALPSSPIVGATPPPVVSPFIPLSSPLWNMSTPSSVGFPSPAIPRVDYRQTFSPLHSTYQTPPMQNSSLPWLSQGGPFAGKWLASLPASSFSAPRFPSLSMTEAIKLSPTVKVSEGPAMKHTYSVSVVHSASTSVFTSLSMDAKITTLSSGQASIDSKSRKRKKATAGVGDQTSVTSQALMSPPPPVAHLPHTMGHIRIPFLVENQTDPVTAPVASSIFSTSVTVSTPPVSITSGRFPSTIPDHPNLGWDKKNVAVMVEMVEDTLKKVEEGNNVQVEDAAGVHAAVATKTKTWQQQPTSSESKSTKRKKVDASPAVNEIPVPRPALIVTAPSGVSYLSPQVLPSQGHSKNSLPAQNQKNSLTTPAACTLFPTSVAKSMAVPIASESSPGRFPASTPRTGLENALPAEDNSLSKVKESKLQAENAALLAAAEVCNCQDVWNRLDSQKNSGVVSDAEAKLMSSAASIAAAATVANMAAAAAKIASNVAEQARLMANEVLESSRTGNFDQSSSIFSLSNVISTNATPASILNKRVDKSNHPNLIISAAREAARRRIEAASAASKHAENLDAIVKAAELAAEAVSQVGKIVAMGDSSALRNFVGADPEVYWKTSSHDHPSGKKIVEAAPNVFAEDILTMKRGQEHPTVKIPHNQMMEIDGSDTGNGKISKAPKPVGLATETDSRVGHGQKNIPSGVWEEHNIKEGCLVEVFKEDDKYKGAWLAANVLSLKGEEALVCYTEVQSSVEGSEEKLKEWVSIEDGGIEVAPRIRIAHPMTTMRLEGARKRRRTAVTDYAWSNGDRVDVRMQDCWREGVVMEANQIDFTYLTVRFPVFAAGQGETSIVRTSHVRPTLIWKDRKWIEWSSLKGGHASEEDETPKEKRMKLGTPAVTKMDQSKDNLPINVESVSTRHEEPGTLGLSAHKTSFNIGKTTTDESKVGNIRMMKDGSQKEGVRVIFGIPKPSKKQKFIDVSKHYGSNKNNNTTNGPSKLLDKWSKQVAGGRGWKTNSKNDNQISETKSRRKPPVPSFRKITHNNKDNSLISSKLATRDSEISDKSNGDSVENQAEAAAVVGGPSSNKGLKKGFSFTSKPKPEHLINKGKLLLATADGKKVEDKDKSISEVNEPRRSNRKIQPTSRLLEGLQSSLTISKIPSFSYASQRSHNKVMSKGNTNHG